MVIAALLAPILVRQARRIVARRYLGGRLATAADEINERFPVTTPVRLVLRAMQATVFVTPGVALLAVWNRTDAAWAVLSAVQVSPIVVGRGALTVALVLGAYVGMGLLEDAIEPFGQGTTRMTAH
jgi:predicted RNA polymerase sigma factor